MAPLIEGTLKPRVPRYVAYYRVSTAKQGRSGLGLEAQRDAVAVYLAGVRGKLAGEYTETESGTRKGNHRPMLAAALAACRVHNATLVIAKLDRLARNVAFVSNLMESSVDFVAVDFPTANRLTIHILAAMAEFEAECISKRTKEALAAYKRRGGVLGGDPENLTPTVCRKGNRASAKVRSEQSQRRAADLLPTIEAIKAEGAQTLRAIAAVLNERGILTARGAAWSAVQVSRVTSKATADRLASRC